MNPGLGVVKGNERSCTQILRFLAKKRETNEEQEGCLQRAREQDPRSAAETGPPLVESVVSCWAAGRGMGIREESGIHMFT